MFEVRLLELFIRSSCGSIPQEITLHEYFPLSHEYTTFVIPTLEAIIRSHVDDGHFASPNFCDTSLNRATSFFSR